MKRTRKNVRTLNWSIRLERLEDRLPLDGGLGAIVQVQPLQINFNYLQLQASYGSSQSSTTANYGGSGGSGQDLYLFETDSVKQSAQVPNIAETLNADTQLVEGRTNAVRDSSSTVSIGSNGGYVPIQNPIMIPLPAPIELIAIADPYDAKVASPIRDDTQIVKRHDAKVQKAIEPTVRIGELNQRAEVSTQSTLENVAINAMVPSYTTREGTSDSAESSINVPVENVPLVKAEPFAASIESRANRISRDMYYGKTDRADDRQELGWTTEVLASATRQQVISESSALRAIIASNISKAPRFNNQAQRDADTDQAEPSVFLVSHVPQFDPWVEVSENNNLRVTNDSRWQSTGSIEVGTDQNTNEWKGLLHSSWGTYVLALVGLTLSLASTETREIAAEPELLTYKKTRLFPFGKGSQ